MTHTYPRPEITLDQQVALKTAATRLNRDFDGTFGTARPHAPEKGSNG